MKHHAEDIPEEFAYLREAVARFGHLSHHEVILNFLENKTDEDMKLLRESGEAVRANNQARPLLQWLRRIERMSDAVSATLSLIGELGISINVDYALLPADEARRLLTIEWALEDQAFSWLGEQSKDLFSPQEIRAFAIAALYRSKKAPARQSAIMALYDVPGPENIELIESYWKDRVPRRRPQSAWGVLAAFSDVSWNRLKIWLDTFGPLRDVAVAALKVLTFDRHVPTIFARPPLVDHPGEAALAAYLSKLIPRLDDEYQEKWLSRVLENVGDIVPA